MRQLLSAGAYMLHCRKHPTRANAGPTGRMTQRWGDSRYTIGHPARQPEERVGSPPRLELTRCGIENLHRRRQRHDPREPDRGAGRTGVHQGPGMGRNRKPGQQLAGPARRRLGPGDRRSVPEARQRPGRAGGLPRPLAGTARGGAEQLRDRRHAQALHCSWARTRCSTSPTRSTRWWNTASCSCAKRRARVRETAAAVSRSACSSTRSK